MLYCQYVEVNQDRETLAPMNIFETDKKYTFWIGPKSSVLQGTNYTSISFCD